MEIAVFICGIIFIGFVVMFIFKDKYPEQAPISSSLSTEQYRNTSQPKADPAVPVKWDYNQTTYTSSSSGERPTSTPALKTSPSKEISTSVLRETSSTDPFRAFVYKYMLENKVYLKSFSHNKYKEEGRGAVNLVIKAHISKTYVVEHVIYVPESLLLKTLSDIAKVDLTGKDMEENVQKHLSTYRPEDGDFIVLSFLETGDWISIPVPGHLIKTSSTLTH